MNTMTAVSAKEVEMLQWCTWCDRPRTDCWCHLDPNGIPEGHWSRTEDSVIGVCRCKHTWLQNKEGACLKCPCSGYIESSKYPLSDEMRSLLWAPEPPFESGGSHDCRMGGSCGLDGFGETRRSRWIQAKFRYLYHQKKLGGMA